MSTAILQVEKQAPGRVRTLPGTFRGFVRRPWLGTLVSSRGLVLQACCVAPARPHALSAHLWGHVVSRSAPAPCFASLAASWVLLCPQPPSARQEVILSLPKGRMNQRVVRKEGKPAPQLASSLLCALNEIPLLYVPFRKKKKKNIG